MSSEVTSTPGPFEVRLEDETSSPLLRSSAPISPSESCGEPSNVSLDAAPNRRYECEHYETCLGLAASLNWESFSCVGCSGQPNQNLMWRARTTARKDSVAARLLNAPPITPMKSEDLDSEPRPARLFEERSRLRSSLFSALRPHASRDS